MTPDSASPVPVAAGVEASETAGRFVGQSVKRVEDGRLVAGSGQYVDDVRLPGMLHGAFLRSDLARARIRRLDTFAAAGLDGVVAVLTADDLNRHVDSLRSSVNPPDLAIVPGHVLAPGDVRFVGDPVALVIADDRYLAEDALELIDVDYEPLAPVVDYEQAATSPHLVHPELGTNLGASDSGGDPGLAAVFESAHLVVTETFHQQRQCNMPMETRGLVAHWQRHAGRLDLWASTQSPHELAFTAARVLGIGEHQVRVHMGDVGGAFGQKVYAGRDEMALLLAARDLGRPIKWIEDRRENLMAANSARVDRLTVTMAVDADGRILGAEIDHLSDSGAYPLGGAPAKSAQLVSMFPGPYRIPRLGWSTATVFTNTVGRGAYRGPWQMETVGRELMMDLVAQRLGLDPLDFRSRNVIERAELPHTSPTGRVYEQISPAETLEQAAEMVGYHSFRTEQAEARAQGRLMGLGLSLFIEPTASGRGVFGTEGAVVRIEPDGSITVAMGTGSHGQGLETTIAQVVADELGVEMERVILRQGDGTPYGFGTGGSRSAVIAGGAAQAAASGVRSRIERIAAHLLEAAPEDIVVDRGSAYVAGTPARRISVADVADAAYRRPEALPQGVPEGLEHTARYRAPEVTHSNAAHACVCEVDSRTGIVRILRYVVSEDCGNMVNPMIVEGQIAGGVVQGIGGALYEWAPYDADGNPQATTLLDYVMPTAAEVPILEHGHVVTPSDTPGGHKGVGEGGAIGAPACVVNAVNDALAPLGIRLARQPLTPDAIISAIAEAESR
jgi:carbon-monoxide dehydrogenase large subunit